VRDSGSGGSRRAVGSRTILFLGLATTALISGAGAGADTGAAATEGAGVGSVASACAGTDADADTPTVTAGGVSLRTGGSLGATAGNAIDSGTKRTGAKPRTAAVCGGVDVADAGVDDPGFDTVGGDAAGVAGAGRDAAGVDAIAADPMGVSAEAVVDEGVAADDVAAEDIAAEDMGVVSIGVANIATAFSSSRSIVAKNMATAPTRTPQATPSRSNANLRRKRTVGAK
jgi:hypothetical protein